MESVGGKQRDYASSTISSWRVREASKISHKSKTSACKTPSHLPRSFNLSNLVKIHAKDKKSIRISKSACKILNLEHKLIKRAKKLLHLLLPISTNPSIRLALTRKCKYKREFYRLPQHKHETMIIHTLEPFTT